MNGPLLSRGGNGNGGGGWIDGEVVECYEGEHGNGGGSSAGGMLQRTLYAIRIGGAREDSMVRDGVPASLVRYRPPWVDDGPPPPPPSHRGRAASDVKRVGAADDRLWEGPGCPPPGLLPGHPDRGLGGLSGPGPFEDKLSPRGAVKREMPPMSTSPDDGHRGGPSNKRSRYADKVLRVDLPRWYDWHRAQGERDLD